MHYRSLENWNSDHGVIHEEISQKALNSSTRTPNQGSRIQKNSGTSDWNSGDAHGSALKSRYVYRTTLPGPGCDIEWEMTSTRDIREQII
jgi:hypothetical protein